LEVDGFAVAVMVAVAVVVRVASRLLDGEEIRDAEHCGQYLLYSTSPYTVAIAADSKQA
jgi:hypothetical protein